MIALQFQPGERVSILEAGIDATVERVTIYRDMRVLYCVVYWCDMRQIELWLTAQEMVSCDNRALEKQVVVKDG